MVCIIIIMIKQYIIALFIYFIYFDKPVFFWPCKIAVGSNLNIHTMDLIISDDSLTATPEILQLTLAAAENCRGCLSDAGIRVRPQTAATYSVFWRRNLIQDPECWAKTERHQTKYFSVNIIFFLTNMLPTMLLECCRTFSLRITVKCIENQWRRNLQILQPWKVTRHIKKANTWVEEG